MGAALGGTCGTRNRDVVIENVPVGEPLPELGEWITRSTRPDLPAVVAETHRSSSREAWFRLLGAGLLEASSEGNLAAVKQLLAGGAERHARDADGRTALHHASMAGHAGVVEFLLEDGEEDGASSAAAAAAASLGRGPSLSGPPRLEWQASTEGHVLVRAVSLKKRGTVDARDDFRSCSVHLAAAYGHAHVVRLLIMHGADISCGDATRQTPVHAAAAGGSSESMRVLLDAGGDVKARDNAGR